MKVKWFILLYSIFNITRTISAQNKFGDLGFDKNNNKYIVGTFDKTIDLGNNNIMTSTGASDIFIGKYDANGLCQWGTKISGKNDDNARSIYVEPNGNFYITGYFIGEAKFGDIVVKSTGSKVFQSITLFVAKYNTSGDPIWVKSSKNSGSDAGAGITSDNKGNIYVLGSFDGQLNYEGKTTISNGKNDICIIKINSAGNCEWVKNYGDKEENTANTIFFHKNKLFIGGASQILSGGYLGYLAAISPETGNTLWTKTIGSTKADVEKISSDNESSLLVTGLIEGNGKENYNLFVNKINLEDGKDVWLRKFPSHQARGRDIVCDPAGNIFVTGSFLDSLRMDASYLSGLEFDDIFFAKLNSIGKTIWAKNFGHNKNDIGSKLILRNNEIILAGEFTSGIEFNKTNLSGGDNTIFTACFDIQKSTFSNSMVLVKEESNSGSESKYSNISGKLLIGAGNDKSFLNDQAVHIEDDSGNLIRRTITDENGDFSFKNIDVSAAMNLVLESNDKLKENDEIFLAEQNGIIVQKLELDKNKTFKFKLLPIIITKLQPLEDEKEPLLVMKDFKISKENEFTLIERILYEPGSFLIPTSSIDNLNQVALFLRQNPKIKIEIFSHTDANGDEQSNLLLSEKRANEVRTFLIKKQISTERITVKGLGETQILNRCGNNVKCTEKEHSFNRRTEFKFIKIGGF